MSVCPDCADTGFLLLCPNDTDGDGDCWQCSKPGGDHPCPNPIHQERAMKAAGMALPPGERHEMPRSS